MAIILIGPCTNNHRNRKDRGNILVRVGTGLLVSDKGTDTGVISKDAGIYTTTFKTRYPKPDRYF